MKIILDTNFLIYAASQKIHYLDKIGNMISKKHEIFILPSVLKELEKIAQDIGKKQSGKDRRSAKLALLVLKDHIDKNKIKKLSALSEKTADKAIVNLAEKEPIIVATADRELKKKLKNMAKLLVIRDKKRLQII